MPTYGYICSSCNHEFDEFQKITDEPLKTCPKCSKPSLKRQVGGKDVSFQFKGKGFYCTDYKKDSCSDCCCNKESCE